MEKYLEKRILDKYSELPVLMVIISCLFLCVIIPHIDDIPYYEKATIAEHPDISWEYDNEKNMMYSKINLQNADVLKVVFNATTDGNTQITIDLYAGKEYNESGMQLDFVLSKGTFSYSGIIPYYRTPHPNECTIRALINTDTDISLPTIYVEKLVVVKDRNRTVKFEFFITLIVLFLSTALLAYVVIKKKKNDLLKLYLPDPVKKNNIPKLLLEFLLITTLVTAILLVLYRNADLRYPFIYTPYDDMGTLTFAKMINEFGIPIINTRAGGINPVDYFESPYFDWLLILLEKIISLFTNNPFLIVNIFYFLCFYLNAFASFVILKLLRFRSDIGVTISILYAFSPYIQRRYAHLYLAPYFTIPIACYITIMIIRDAFDKESQITYETLYKSAFASYICSYNGTLYYQFFFCALYSVALLVLLLNKKNTSVKRLLYPFVYILSVLFAIISSIIPYLMYTSIHGENPLNDVNLRSSVQAEVYALRFIQLILPHDQHRMPFFRNITANYNSTYPLITENSMVSLGLIASIGFIISLVLLFKQSKKNKELSIINVATFLIATIGGVSSFIALFLIKGIRSYNRMSTIIMFISLVEIAVLLQFISKKINKKLYYILLAFTLILGIFDQTYSYEKIDYSQFESDKAVVQRIEASMPSNSMIFILPYSNWPSDGLYRNDVGYLFSDNLRWSYPVAQGREDAEWQKRVASSDVNTMISELKAAGYDGLYLDKSMFTYLAANSDINQTENYINTINKTLSTPSIISKDNNIYFWKF